MNKAGDAPVDEAANQVSRRLDSMAGSPAMSNRGAPVFQVPGHRPRPWAEQRRRLRGATRRERRVFRGSVVLPPRLLRR
jgi:hypothetical protein